MKKAQAFTTMELLAVMTIILIIMGIGFPAYNSWRSRSEIAGARATIARIEMALEMYKSDYGVYPQSSGGLNANGLVYTSLAPYAEFKTNELNGNRVIDPWGNAYVVYTAPGSTSAGAFSHNRSSYYIYSCGPDGPTGNSNDDIDNYNSF